MQLAICSQPGDRSQSSSLGLVTGCASDVSRRGLLVRRILALSKRVVQVLKGQLPGGNPKLQQEAIEFQAANPAAGHYEAALP